MKKVLKHKETGTELFKGKNWVHAGKHYKEALGHCRQFVDLSADDEAEVTPCVHAALNLFFTSESSPNLPSTHFFLLFIYLSCF